MIEVRELVESPIDRPVASDQAVAVERERVIPHHLDTVCSQVVEQGVGRQIERTPELIDDHADLDTLTRLLPQHRSELLGDLALTKAVLDNVNGRASRANVVQDAWKEAGAVDQQLDGSTHAMARTAWPGLLLQRARRLRPGRRRSGHPPSRATPLAMGRLLAARAV